MSEFKGLRSFALARESAFFKLEQVKIYMDLSALLAAPSHIPPFSYTVMPVLKGECLTEQEADIQRHRQRLVTQGRIEDIAGGYLMPRRQLTREESVQAFTASSNISVLCKMPLTASSPSMLNKLSSHKLAKAFKKASMRTSKRKTSAELIYETFDLHFWDRETAYTLQVIANIPKGYPQLLPYMDSFRMDSSEIEQFAVLMYSVLYLHCIIVPTRQNGHLRSQSLHLSGRKACLGCEILASL